MAQIVYTFSVVDHVTPVYFALEAALAKARHKAEESRNARDECHHCGAPSPGDVCRYCNTARRRKRQ